MEEAIFAVMVIGIAAGVWGYCDIRSRMDSSMKALVSHHGLMSNLVNNSSATLNLLTEASKRNALREKPEQSAFDKSDNDKIPPSGQRYVPVARRRAAAEAASAGPATHREQVAANNARVMETL